VCEYPFWTVGFGCHRIVKPRNAKLAPRDGERYRPGLLRVQRHADRRRLLADAFERLVGPPSPLSGVEGQDDHVVEVAHVRQVAVSRPRMWSRSFSATFASSGESGDRLLPWAPPLALRPRRRRRLNPQALRAARHREVARRMTRSDAPDAPRRLEHRHRPVQLARGRPDHRREHRHHLTGRPAQCLVQALAEHADLVRRTALAKPTGRTTRRTRSTHPLNAYGEDVAVDAADRCSSAADRVRLVDDPGRLAADRVRPSPCLGSLERVVVRPSLCLFLVADDLFVDDEDRVFEADDLRLQEGDLFIDDDDLFVKKEVPVWTEADLVSSSTCL
jgi:hypothetical protein